MERERERESHVAEGGGEGVSAGRKWERASSVAAAYSAKSKPASPVYIPRTGRKGARREQGWWWWLARWLDVSAAGGGDDLAVGVAYVDR